jgi:large subunit ribosomal protein L24e
MAKCSFCGGNTPQARGKMFIRNDGKIFYFCNSKCHNNWKLRREGKKVKWTHTFRKEAAGKKATKPPSGENQKATGKVEKKAG